MTKSICYIAHHLDSVNGWGRVGRMIISHAKKHELPYTLLEKKPSALQNRLLTPVANRKIKLQLSYIDSARHYKIIKAAQVIHCLTEPMIPLAYAAHKVSGNPLIINLYGTYAVKSLTGRLADTYRRAYQSASTLLLPSRHTAEQLLSYYPELEPKIRIIALASCFVTSDQSLSFQERTASAIFVGEIKKRKGILPLLKAAKTAIRSGILEKLYLVGTVRDAHYHQQLLSYVQQEELEPFVIFTGPIDDYKLSHLYASSRVSVLPSIAQADSFEGFGLVHLESFAHATPSIGCRESGSEAAIKHGYNGWLVSPMDTSGLTQALVDIVGDAQTWDALSKNCRQDLRMWDDVLNDYRSIYDTTNVT